jgi:hypothetical protein
MNKISQSQPQSSIPIHNTPLNTAAQGYQMASAAASPSGGGGWPSLLEAIEYIVKSATEIRTNRRELANETKELSQKIQAGQDVASDRQSLAKSARSIANRSNKLLYNMKEKMKSLEKAGYDNCGDWEKMSKLKQMLQNATVADREIKKTAQELEKAVNNAPKGTNNISLKEIAKNPDQYGSNSRNYLEDFANGLLEGAKGAGEAIIGFILWLIGQAIGQRAQVPSEEYLKGRNEFA